MDISKSKRNQKPILLDYLLVVIGIVMLAFIQDLPNVRLQSIVQAIGTSFTAGGILNWLLRNLLKNEDSNEKIPDLVLVSPSRSAIASELYQSKYSSQKVDVMGISVTGALRDYSSSSLLAESIVSRNVRIRVLFMNPFSDAVSTKNWEDGITADELKERLVRSVLMCKDIWDKIHLVANNRSPNQPVRGSISVKLIDHHPLHGIYRCDEKMYWGMYTSARKGTDLPLVEVSGAASERLKEHFVWHWERAPTRIMMCSDIQAKFHLEQSLITQCEKYIQQVESGVI